MAISQGERGRARREGLMEQERRGRGAAGGALRVLEAVVEVEQAAAGRGPWAAWAVEQEAIAVESGEQGGGAMVDLVGEALERWQGVVAELVFEGGVHRAEGDEGGFDGVLEQVERGELGMIAQGLRVEGHGAPPA